VWEDQGPRKKSAFNGSSHGVNEKRKYKKRAGDLKMGRGTQEHAKGRTRNCLKKYPGGTKDRILAARRRGARGKKN